MPEYKVVCFTGGPCGGKTSAVSILTDYFESLGFKVYRVPETATVLFGGGISFPELNDEMKYSIQKSILRVMLELEDSYRDLARLNCERGQKTVLICDRGAMDPSAYMPRDEWLKMLNEMNLQEQSLRDFRYDAVVHLVTAAKGAQQYYRLDNNATRTEGIELAQKMDSAVMKAWMGHSGLSVIDNESVANFREKCDRIIQTVAVRLGLIDRTTSAVVKQKFLVKSCQIEKLLEYKEFDVEHLYLINTQADGKQTRIRKRREIGASTQEFHYSLTTRHVVNEQKWETRRNLRPREYEDYKSQQDPQRVAIKKHRRCFLFNDRYFQLDTFLEPHKNLILLEAYLHKGDDRGAIPEWLVVEDVTDDPSYSMYNLSLKSL